MDSQVPSVPHEEVGKGEGPVQAPLPFRLILHCRPVDVTSQLVAEVAKRELGPVEIQDYLLDEAVYFQEVTVASGPRLIPVSIITLRYRLQTP